jgi:putative Mn2+ efflux pump MntP
VVTGSLAAFCGVMIGKKYLHKVTMKSVQTLVGILLFGVGLALLLGVL